jgi:ketosteroid isomerase-like protein
MNRMDPITREIIALEERLRDAELGPDPRFFEDALADDAVIVSQDGEPIAKWRIVEAHRPGRGRKFTRVEMSDTRIVGHGDIAVVTCKGRFEGPGVNDTLRFMRVWQKRAGRWRIVAASISG